MTVSAPLLRILLVDDSAVVREGLKILLQADANNTRVEVVAEASTTAEVLPLVAQHKPDIVLLDIRLPDGSGIDLCREIVDTHPEVRVLILTSFAHDELVYDAIRAGARGYLLKEVDPAGLLRAIRDAAAGKAVFDPDTAARLARLVAHPAGSQPGDLRLLSPQEERVVALVSEGLTNKQIGERLDLSNNTVKNYLCSAFEKLGVSRRSQAAVLYSKAKKGTMGLSA